MPRNQRFALLGLAALIAVIAVVVLGSGSDDAEPTRPVTTAETTTPEPTAPGADATPQPTATATPKPRPPVPTLSADNPRRLRLKEGDTIRFAVESSEDEEIHVHGYDKSTEVTAGKRTQMSFKATITGIFEIELEHSGTPLGELEVRP